MKWMLIVFIAGAISCQAATTWYVATSGSDTAAGTAWTNALLTISNGVKKATTVGDTVLVSNGTYVVTTNINITSNITVRSWNNGNYDRTNTIIDGNWPTTTNRCLYLDNIGAVVAGFTFTNGCEAAASGGGIYLRQGTVSNCIISGNQSFRTNNDSSSGGGGIYASPNSGTTSWIYNCEISGNMASNNGGGIRVNSGTTTVANCIIRNNSARFNSTASSGDGGGGIQSYCGVAGSICVINNCLVVSNYSTIGGGGAQFTYKTKAYNCTFQYNFASNIGGGVLLPNDVSLYSCLIANNTTPGIGGGVYVSAAYYANTGLYNCTISSNLANYGGGLQVNKTTGNGWSIYNTIIWRNTATNVTAGRSNIYFVTANGATGLFYNCVLGGTNFDGSAGCIITNSTDQNPQMMDVPGGNYRLAPGSPGIDTGLNQEWMANSFDLDGHARIDHFRQQVDMGAYEYLPRGTLITCQ